MNVNNLHLKQERARIYIYIYTHTIGHNNPKIKNKDRKLYP